MAYAKRVGAQYAPPALRLAAAIVVGLGFMAFATGGATAKSRSPAPIVYERANPSDAAPMTLSSSSGAMRIKTPREFAHVQPRDAALTSEAFDARRAGAIAAPRPQKSRVQTVSSSKLRTHAPAQEAPAGFAKQKIGAPYQIMGKWYVPTAEPDYDEVGIASWYGPKFHGRPTANGETFDMNAMTAAHPTLPIASLARVTNLENGRSVVVRVNDRGPFIGDRLIDMSRRAAQVLDFEAQGKAKVRVQYMGFAPEAHNSLPPKYANQDRAVAAVPIRQPVKPSASVSRSGGHVVQAGAFVELGNAHSLRAQLHSFGAVFINETRINGSDYFRVMVGPWSTEVEAVAAKRNMNYAGYNGVVVRAP